MQYPDFHESVLYWAKIRGFDESDPRAQFLSCVEESVKEISESKMNLNDTMLSDSIGDTAVTLIILEMQLHKRTGKAFPGYNNVVVGSYMELMFAIGSIGANLRREKWYEALEMVYFAMNSLKAFAIKEDMYFDECCGHAWDEIKNRNGMMINGSYVKEADFTDEQARVFRQRNEFTGDSQWTPKQIEAFKKENRAPVDFSRGGLMECKEHGYSYLAGKKCPKCPAEDSIHHKQRLGS